MTLTSPRDLRDPERLSVLVVAGPSASDLAVLLDPDVEVRTASTLRQGLEDLSSGPAPSCVVLAIDLPDADGIDAAAAVVARQPWAPVVVVTPHDDHAVLEAIGVGADDALVAGTFDRAVLMRRIRMAIQRKKVTRGALRVGGQDDDARGDGGDLDAPATAVSPGDDSEFTPGARRIDGADEGTAVAIQESELRDALDSNQFRLFFQPQVRLQSGEIVSFEALVRWEHPQHGLLSPAAFIDIADDYGLTHALGQWILEEACRRLAEWRRRFPERRLSVAINMSGGQLADSGLPELLQSTLDSYGIEPAALCLELTESMLMTDAEGAVATLRRLRAIGVRLSIDDFGTGYSSLAYLKRFPIDQLKVDRSFVAGLGRDPEDFVIVSAIVNLAKSLGVEVVAEGVENDRHLAELEAIGCALAQGYLWSPPVPAATVPALLERAALVRTTRPVAPADREPQQTSQAIDVVSLLTHELRAPLTVIKGYAETMTAHVDASTSPLIAKASTAIARNVSALDDLIATLSDVNALESGNFPMRRKPTDVGALVRETIADHSHLFPNHTVDVDAPTGIVANLDPARVRQIILNLASNAAKFSPPATTITITVTATDNEIEISVVDQGAGVPPEMSREIFRKFFRVDNSKKGSGLGLYIARSLARAHGGELVCRQASSGGAEFVLSLSKTTRSSVTTPVPRPDGDRASAAGATGAAPPGAQVALTAALTSVRTAIVREQVVAAGIELAKALGGGTTPARLARADALPYDISCGVGEALFATAPPGSAGRVALEHALPRFIDAALSGIAERAETTAADANVDGLTGFAGRRLIARSLARLREGATVVLVGVGGAQGDNTMRALARIVREAQPEGAVAGRFNDDQIVVLFSDTRIDAAVIERFLMTLQKMWDVRRPEEVALAAGSAVVGSGGPQSAILQADRACQVAL